MDYYRADADFLFLAISEMRWKDLDFRFRRHAARNFRNPLLSTWEEARPRTHLASAAPAVRRRLWFLIGMVGLWSSRAMRRTASLRSQLAWSGSRRGTAGSRRVRRGHLRRPGPCFTLTAQLRRHWSIYPRAMRCAIHFLKFSMSRWLKSKSC